MDKPSNIMSSVLVNTPGLLWSRMQLGGVDPVKWKPGCGDTSFDLGEGSSPVTSVQVDDKPPEQGTFNRTEDGRLVMDSSVLEGLALCGHTLEVWLEDGSVIAYLIRMLPVDKPSLLFTGEW